MKSRVAPMTADSHCPVCNDPLFKVVPFETSQEAIVAFARKSNLPGREGIVESRWMHPGVYCAQGCTEILVEYGRPELPAGLSVAEGCSIAQRHAKQRYSKFVATHGDRSRLVACVHCRHFDGATVEGWASESKYRNPKHRPLSTHRVRTAVCRVGPIQRLSGTWWYDEGQAQPKCAAFKPDTLFIFAYKAVMGWSEYSDE